MVWPWYYEDTVREYSAKSLSRIFTIAILNKEERKEKRRKLYDKLRFNFGFRGYTKTKYDCRYIYKGQEGSNRIIKLLNENKPCLIARFGSVEFSALYYFLQSKKQHICYPDNIKYEMSNNAGFFPADDEKISRFSGELVDVIRNVDLMCCRFERKEEEVLSEYAPTAMLTNIVALDAFIYDDPPWTKCLAGKKVLLIHPFSKTIEMQYQKRKNLFKNPEILPAFELKTLTAVQSIADAKNSLAYKDWFEALDDMCKQIETIDFDVAIVGAGAYGIFLANHCKNLGKQAIHMGGATQMLFGIYGDRWKYYPMINEYWTRPLEDERPAGAEKVESACYW